MCKLRGANHRRHTNLARDEGNPRSSRGTRILREDILSGEMRRGKQRAEERRVGEVWVSWVWKTCRPEEKTVRYRGSGRDSDKGDQSSKEKLGTTTLGEKLG